MKTLEDQKSLENRCEELLTRRAQLKVFIIFDSSYKIQGLANKTKKVEVEKEIKEISKKLRDITNGLCRTLRDNPNLSNTIKKIVKERSSIQNLLGETIKDLGEGNFDSLSKQIDNDNIERNRLGELQRQEKELREAVKKLEDTIKKEDTTHLRTMREKNDKIIELKHELVELSKKTTEELEYNRKEARSKLDTTLKQYKMEEDNLEQKLSELKNSKDQSTLVHEETSKFLQSKQKVYNIYICKIIHFHFQEYESMIEEWTLKYDEDIRNISNRFAALETERKNDLERLNSLKERYDKELADKKEEEDTLKNIAELEIEVKKEEKEKVDGIIMIQRAWRHYKWIKDAKLSLEPKKKKRRGGKKKK